MSYTRARGLSTDTPTPGNSSSTGPLQDVDLNLPPHRSTNPFDEEPFDEEAGHSAFHKRPLQYLQVFSKSQLLELETQHSRGACELDDLVHEHHWWYKFFLIDTVYAIGTEISSTSFQILLSRDGIKGGAKLIKNDLEVSDTTGLAISAPLALADTAYKLATVSARQTAIKRTLDYALSDSYKDQLEEFLELGQEEPREASGLVVRWGFNKLVIYTHSFLYSTANFLAFYEPVTFSLPFAGEVTVPAWLPQLPTSAQLGIAAGFIYGGHRYSSLFVTPDYEQNFRDFMWQGVMDLWEDNPEGQPWMVGELFRGKISTPIQVLLRSSASTAFTRAYPRFLNIAETVFGKLAGLDSDTSAALSVTTTVLIGWHLFCAEYPKSYYRSMADHIKIEAILRSNLEASIGQAIDQMINAQIDSQDLALSARELNKRKLSLRKQLMKSFIETERRLYQSQVLEGLGDDFAFKMDPTLKPQLAVQVLLGLYLGGTTLAPFLLRYINEPVPATLLSLTFASGFLATTFYRDRKAQLTNQLVRRRIDPEIKAAEAAAASGKPDSAKAGALIVAANVSRALAVLGSGERTFGHGNRPAMAAAVSFVAQGFIEALHLTYKKAQVAISGWSCCRRKKPAQLSDSRAAFFDHGSPRAVAETKAKAASATVSSRRSWLPKFMQSE